MNSTNLDDITVFNLKFRATEIPKEIDIFKQGFPEIYKHFNKDMSVSFLFKPLNQSAMGKFEHGLTLNDYSSTQRQLLLNAFNFPYVTNIMPADSPFFGLKTVSGYITKNSQPTAFSKITIFDSVSKTPVKDQISDKDGYFSFPDLVPSRSYFLVSFDSVGEMNAVVLSGVLP